MMISEKHINNQRSGLRALPAHLALAMAGSGTLYSQEDLISMVEGIQKYQSHSFCRPDRGGYEIWGEGCCRVFHYPVKEKKTSLFIVPSMINGTEIFDLAEQRSFIRWMNEQGVEIFLLDWGQQALDPEVTGIEFVLEKRLCAALGYVGDICDVDVFALGYCMGGTLLAQALEKNNNLVKGAIFLASPWDFKAGNQSLANQVKAGRLNALQMIEAQGILPVNWIQTVFASANADRTVDKFKNFAAQEQESVQAHMFVATEDWLNGGYDLPGSIARTCISDWYGDNILCAGESIFLEMPSLIMASATDRLVPIESSLALAECLKDVTILKPDIGHIGMMVSSRAEQSVWQPILSWLLK